MLILVNILYVVSLISVLGTTELVRGRDHLKDVCVLHQCHCEFGILGDVAAVPEGFVGCFYCRGLAAKSLFTQSLCFALTALPLQTSPERLIPEPRILH